MKYRYKRGGCYDYSAKIYTNKIMMCITECIKKDIELNFESWTGRRFVDWSRPRPTTLSEFVREHTVFVQP